MHKNVTLAILIFCFVLAKGQDTLVQPIILKKTFVVGSRISLFGNTEGEKKIDLSLTRFKSLADALQENQNLFVRSYGSGMLSTLSMRGLNGAQVSLLWNGINIQSPMNGLMDLNLLPCFFTDEITVESGATSSVYGNGTIAGAVSMNNSKDSAKSVLIMLQSGSFNNHLQGVKVSYGKNACFSTRVFNKTGINNFPYYRPDNGEKAFQKNNYLSQRGILQEFYCGNSEKNQFTALFWLQHTNRGLPYTMFASETEEKQNDQSARVLLNHVFKKSKYIWQNKFAYVWEQIHYVNPKASINASHQVHSFVVESDYINEIKHNTYLQFGMNQTVNQGISPYFSTIKKQAITNISVSFKKLKKRHEMQLSVRTLFNGSITQPILPYFKYAFKASKNTLIYSNVGFSIRVPSFNDLYWILGGNESLRAEKSVREELGIKHENKGLQTEFVAFNYQVHNWIAWISSGNIFKATNFRKVWSRGVEMSARKVLKIRKNTLTLSSAFSYTLSTHRKVEPGNENITDKQLILSPIHSGRTSLQWTRNNWKFSSGLLYTGYRYTDSENYNWLPGYYLLNLKISKNWKENFSLAFEANNLTNQYYEVMPSRPMPGINFSISILYKLK